MYSCLCSRVDCNNYEDVTVQDLVRKMNKYRFEALVMIDYK